MFEIYFNNKPVGTAEVIRTGLYYFIKCCCQIEEKGIHRISVSDGIHVIDLGICVPKGEVFTLTTSIPIKRLSGEKLVFHLNKNKKQNEGIPVASGMQFDHLDKLNGAKLQAVNGKMQIVINPVLSQQDSDQNQKHLNKSVQQ